jgi:hypothetical protein
MEFRCAWYLHRNEFSDHKFERRNYLNLEVQNCAHAASGLSWSPALILHAVSGEVRIERGGKTLWSKAIESARNIGPQSGPISNIIISSSKATDPWPCARPFLWRPLS